MAEKEYIERDLLIDIFNSKSDMAIGTPKMVFASAAKMIDALPAADVVEVRHARWIDEYGKTWCSRCDASNKQYKPPYCPHCGAKMDGRKEDEGK